MTSDAAHEPLATFACDDCGELHEAPLAYRFWAPDQWSGAQAKYEMESWLGPWHCEIEGVGEYVRGIVEIPVSGTDAVLTWDLWAEEHRISTWYGPLPGGRPVFGNRLPYLAWGEDVSVVVERRLGRPALLTPADPDHPLAVEIRDGITPSRVAELATLAVAARGHTISSWLLRSWHGEHQPPL